MSQSGRDWPTGGTAARQRCTRRSVLVKVPSFSAKLTAGRITSAISPVSLMKMSWQTRNSSLSSAWRACSRFGSLIIGFSPNTNMPRTAPL